MAAEQNKNLSILDHVKAFPKLPAKYRSKTSSTVKSQKSNVKNFVSIYKDKLQVYERMEQRHRSGKYTVPFIRRNLSYVINSKQPNTRRQKTDKIFKLDDMILQSSQTKMRDIISVKELSGNENITTTIYGVSGLDGFNNMRLKMFCTTATMKEVFEKKDSLNEMLSENILYDITSYAKHLASNEQSAQLKLSDILNYPGFTEKQVLLCFHLYQDNELMAIQVQPLHSPQVSDEIVDEKIKSYRNTKLPGIIHLHNKGHFTLPLQICSSKITAPPVLHLRISWSNSNWENFFYTTNINNIENKKELVEYPSVIEEEDNVIVNYEFKLENNIYKHQEFSYNCIICKASYFNALFFLLKHCVNCHPAFNIFYQEDPWANPLVNISVNNNEPPVKVDLYYDGKAPLKKVRLVRNSQEYCNSPKALDEFRVKKRGGRKKVKSNIIIPTPINKRKFYNEDLSLVNLDDMEKSDYTDGSDWINNIIRQKFESNPNLSEGEKIIMTEWTLFMSNDRSIKSIQNIPTLCHKFVKERCVELCIKNNIMYSFIVLHLVNLHNHGICSGDDLYKIITSLQEAVYNKIKPVETEESTNSAKDLPSAEITEESSSSAVNSEALQEKNYQIDDNNGPKQRRSPRKRKQPIWTAEYDLKRRKSSRLNK